jgi:ABC-type bacteriocin/lantibiotic exporter with double-glycine peptidase domain
MYANGKAMESGTSLAVIGILFIISFQSLYTLFIARTIFATAKASFIRLGQILALEEKTVSTSTIKLEQDERIKVENASISWGFKIKKQKSGISSLEDASDIILSDLNFKVKNGEFLGVFGKVGCGKTSLLAAIMREN